VPITFTQPICSQSFADVHDTFNSDMLAVDFIVEENHSSPKMSTIDNKPPSEHIIHWETN
jgi:hypothetical protein